MKIRRQHYVPRFYLRNFGNPLYCYDKTDDKVFKTGVENIAVESNFYGPAIKGQVSFESALSQMEGRYGSILSEIIKNEHLTDLTLENRLDLSGFITLQYLRSKEARTRIEDMGNSLLDEVTKSLGITDFKVRYTDQHTQAMHMMNFKNFPYFAAIVSRMKMILVKNITGMSYWTSDNPTALWNEFDQFPFGNMGLASKGIEIHIPLTPKLGLIACDPIAFHSLPDKMVDSHPDRIIRENWLQLQHSYRFIYSDNKHFPLAKKMLKKSPESRNPDRKRIERGTALGNIRREPMRRKPVRDGTIQALELWLTRDELKELEDLMAKEDGA
jgi:hypothetical protein